MAGKWAKTDDGDDALCNTVSDDDDETVASFADC